MWNKQILGKKNHRGYMGQSKAGVCPALSLYDRICNRPAVGNEMLIQLVLFLVNARWAYQVDEGVIPQVF